MNGDWMELPEEEIPDMCSCLVCGWSGKILECEEREETVPIKDSPFFIHICPIGADDEGVDL